MSSSLEMKAQISKIGHKTHIIWPESQNEDTSPELKLTHNGPQITYNIREKLTLKNFVLIRAGCYPTKSYEI